MLTNNGGDIKRRHYTKLEINGRSAPSSSIQSSLLNVLTTGYTHTGVDQLRNAKTQRNPTALQARLFRSPKKIRDNSWMASSSRIPSACVQKNWSAPDCATGTAPPESATTCMTPEIKNVKKIFAYRVRSVPGGRCKILFVINSAGPFKLSCMF
jgi:hypothetical protein